MEETSGKPAGEEGALEVVPNDSYVDYWYDKETMPYEKVLEEHIRQGNFINFRFRGRDYNVDWLFIGTLEGEDADGGCPPYPGIEQPNTFEEFCNLRFLDGMTFAEAFDELRFFETC
ncbi:MAG: hypothetical protein LBG81_05720 [Coriobacteriaceae bacterium]|jgi:hypothetical protein|nr:hypothetical protein [Coriobacteriaceae bacterium]